MKTRLTCFTITKNLNIWVSLEEIALLEALLQTRVHSQRTAHNWPSVVRVMVGHQNIDVVLDARLQIVISSDLEQVVKVADRKR